MKKSTKTVIITCVIALSGAVVLAVYTLSRPMHREWTRHDQATEHIRILSEVLELYHEKHGSYPSTDQGLEPLVAEEYLRKIPMDPWGNAYHYVCPGIHNPRGYDLWSNGSDGQEGGSDLKKDVKNWSGA